MTQTCSRTARNWVATATVLALLTAACSGDDSASDETADSTTTSAAPATSEPTSSAEPEAPTYTATIRRTDSNVPHVIAETLPDVMFGYGYAFSEDHACSLADAILTGRSEMARYHGEEWVEQDLVYAGLDIYEKARVEFDSYEPSVQDIIRAYAGGFNAYLEATGVDNVPGWCQGGEWLSPIDEYDLAAYYKILTLRASIDPLIGLIADASPPDGSGEEAAGVGTDVQIGFDELLPGSAPLASNAWAIGPDRTVDSTTMLLGTPHFPWQGLLRFYEVQLTVPGELNVYGAGLLGTPVVLIGFNESVAWSHTVSAGSRFTAYTLDLAEGDPTSYHYGDEIRSLLARDVSIDVMLEDGSVDTVTDTIWFSHYGPVLNFPGIGWTEQATITIRDANADNDEIIPQFLDMNLATSMDEFIQAHADNQGIPWVNTVAASSEGRIWYADTSATPNLSPEALTAWAARTETDLFTGVAIDNGVFLLDGSDPLYEWVDHPDARDPGVVPFGDTPQLERSDFVFNSNDPYWIANPAEPLTGFSPLHGRAERQLSPRTRMNAVQLSVDNGDSGADSLYTLEELAASALSNRVFTAEILVDGVVESCERNQETAHPAAIEACSVLISWDRLVNLDSEGAHVWREFMDIMRNDVWRIPFDPADPIGTPRGVVGGDPGNEPVIDALVEAVSRIEEAGFALDTPLGEIQFADRNGARVPIHGGFDTEGVTNIVRYESNGTTSELDIGRRDRIGDSSNLTADGYHITGGTSFMYALEFTADGPVARGFLTYGETGDPTSEFFVDQTQRFSAKDWRPFLFTEADLAESSGVTIYEVSG